ncbi:choline transporter-like 2 isoform X3 [Toxorhynchites rutilus septentrionalis]|uniref:choline transporter-like 2 isoform X3 n=1 Tax=Toxorhynchites rutilus septentrionalis TaxID=329112 RepID=UPI0024794437|nr:choline transporter-like 2 isoform X3 [Toxorhynchites rutilus septentrionalis]
MGLCWRSDSIIHHTINDVQHPSESQPLKFDPDFKGPLSKRSCTDIPCLLLFVAFLVGWGAVAYYALRNGDLDRLLVPTDSNGLKCGVDSEVLKEPYLVFFDITECAKYDVPLYGCKTPQVCVSECPNENFRFEQQYCNPSTLKTLQSKLICEHTVHKDQLSCEDIQVYIDRGRCAKYYLKSVPFSRRCLPDLQTNGEEIKQDIINGVLNIKLFAGTGQMVVEDILETWKLVIIFMLLSLLASLIFITMLRWIAKPMVWISILGVIAALCYGVYYSYSQYSYIRAHPVESHINVSPNLSSLFESWFKSDRTWLWILVILSIILVVLLLVVLVLRKRIVIAIALVKEGSKAVSAIFSTVFFPIIPWVLHILVIVFAVAVGLYLASIGEPVHRVYGLNSSTTCVCNNGYKDGDICDPIVFNDHCHNSVLRDNSGRCMDAACHFQEIHSPKEVGYFHAINVVGFFWGICFVSAFGDMVLAFTFATWYWTFHKRNLRFFVLTTGFMRTVRYHLGTLAVGALIIAICKIIRAMLEYIDHKLRKFDNGVVRAVLCVCKCCFWCLENFLKFLNTNAYIMCAIHGKNFCSSAKDAFSLLARNVLRVIALDKVTGFLFFLSKLLLACGMAAVTYVFFDSGITPSLHFPLVPAILVFIGTYVIASVFFSVYSVAVDTLFLCFLEDCERNDGSAEKPYFMSKNLMKILGKKQKFITNR